MHEPAPKLTDRAGGGAYAPAAETEGGQLRGPSESEVTRLVQAQDNAAAREHLRQLRPLALQQRAEAVGVEQNALASAKHAEAVIDLVLQHMAGRGSRSLARKRRSVIPAHDADGATLVRTATSDRRTQLRAELQALTPHALINRAQQALVGENELEKAKDQAAIIDLIIARDSDATLSVFLPEHRWLGKLLSRADGEPSLLFRAIQAVIVVLAIVWLTTLGENNADAAGMEQPNDLLHVTTVLTILSELLLLLPLESARISLQPAGMLQQLGVGTQRISVADATHLLRWRVGLGVLSLICNLAGLLLIVQGVINGTNAFEPRACVSVGNGVVLLLMTIVILLSGQVGRTFHSTASGGKLG